MSSEIEAPRYKVGTIQDMAAIPEEALPRFIAELPAILKSVRDVQEAAPYLAQQAREKAPWWLKAIPQSAYERTFQRSITAASVWIDDDKGMATVSMRFAKDADPFFQSSVKMGDA